MDRVEDIIEALIEEVKNLNKELILTKKLYNQEHSARLAIAEELEIAHKHITRLKFFLENT